MKREIPVPAAIAVIALVLVLVVAFVATRQSSAGPAEKKLDSWVQKMRGATPRPGTRPAENPYAARGGAVAPAPARDRR
ncbi:MAG: hypothetical protein IT208_00305 [Chthonomonadales bacterium]|nr:hypothetical protein [Chthonomonadales bacterium]